RKPVPTLGSSPRASFIGIMLPATRPENAHLSSARASAAGMRRGGAADYGVAALAALSRSPRPASLNLAAYSTASATQASVPRTNGIAATRKSVGTESFSAISLPPKIGPRIEPKRPTPNAQPEPFDRTEVG